MLSLINHSCILTLTKDDKIAAYLDRKEIAYEKICNSAGLEAWELFTSQSGKTANLSRIDFSDFFNDDTLQQNISMWFNNRESIKNDTLRRRIEIWNNILTCSRVNYDKDIVRLQNRLESGLNTYPDGELTRNEIEQGLRNLVKMRNNKARSLGYGNYAYLILQNTGNDTIWFNNLINTIDSTTFAPYNIYLNELKSTLGKDSITIADLMEDITKVGQLTGIPYVPNESKMTQLGAILKDIGFDIEIMPLQFGINDLPPGIGGFGNAISIPTDFRAVVNHQLSFRYCLHEIGHGLQWTNVSTPYAVLKGYEWCAGNTPYLYYEGMAETVSGFCLTRDWLLKNGYTDSQVDSINLLENRLTPLILRFALYQSLFEIEMYKNPHKDPSELKMELYQRYLLTSFTAPRPANLLMLSYISYPVYEQNYLISRIISWQVHDYLRNSYGDNYTHNPEIGAFLATKLWAGGELIPWQQRIKESTGKELDIIGYLESLGL